MATRVYLLTDGLPDDRRIRAVLSTREAAEAALRFGDGGAAVEEFEVDGPLPVGPAGHSLWNVCDFAECRVLRIAAFEPDGIDQVVDEGDCYTVNVWARDEDDALRTGMEKIGRFKAEQGVVA